MKVGELLGIFQTRLDMQTEDVTNPSDNIKQVTKKIVEKLSTIDKDEIIDIVVVNENELHTRYILNSTGEVLVEKYGK